jgi:hypothetical protein
MMTWYQANAVRRARSVGIRGVLGGTLASAPKGRTVLRMWVGLGVWDRTPVRVVPGDSAPALSGQCGRWATRVLRGCYKRHEWVRSTLLVSVGSDWPLPACL